MKGTKVLWWSNTDWSFTKHIFLMKHMQRVDSLFAIYKYVTQEFEDCNKLR